MQRLGRVMGSAIAAMLTVFSLQAMAATQQAGRDFDHTTTGFPLVGMHATAACETCHVGGVFKGTEKTCSGCHAIGKRIVATPKSTSHIVTDAPCETCHFNTSSFLGARYNHGTAVPGQCVTCHNGRQSTARPGSHSSNTYQATKSCDQCHRSYTWLPASWNHIGIAPTSCDRSTCHQSGSNTYYRGYGHNHTGYQLTDPACEDCHNFSSWTPAPYKHNSGQPCANCHNGVIATGQGPTHGNTGSTPCNTCHTNTLSWLGASYHTGAVAGICGTCHNGTIAKGKVNDPNGTHIPTVVGDPNCDLCHTSTTTFTAYRMNHGGIATCNNCHASTSVYVVTTKRVLGNHQTSTAAQDCSNCHTSTSTWAGALGVKPANHIPYTAGVPCNSCHINGAVVTGATLHAFVSSVCKTCHNSSPVYLGSMERKTLGSHEGSSTSQDCTSCHARQFNAWDHP